MDSIKIGKKIKDLRQKHNISQEELGAKLYVTRKSVSKWETGYAIPSLECLQNIVQIFDISLEELISDDDSFINSPNKYLKTYDYDFEYNGKQLDNMTLDYTFSAIIIEKNTSRKRITLETPVLQFDITAKDDKNEEYKLSFMINTDLNLLQNLPSKPKNMSKYLVEGEGLIYEPKNKKYAFLNIVRESELYSKPAFLWMAKLSNDVNFFKIYFLEEKLFLWFKIKF